MSLTGSELQAHGRALRRLACELVGSADADDLVQDTLVVAMKQSSRPERLVAWLAGVLRNLAGKHRRGQQRRRRRECEVARECVHPSAELVAELGDSMRRLTDVVLALPQPYREVVMLRYLHEMPPDRIATSLARPVATVKSQLRRGLAMLRSQFDDGSGCDWRTSFAIAFGAGRVADVTSSVAATSGILGMITMGKCLVAAAVLLFAISLSIVMLGRSSAEGVEPMSAMNESGPASALVESKATRAMDLDLERFAAKKSVPLPPRRSTVVDELLQLDAAALYAELVRWFEQDAEFAVVLSRALVSELLLGSGTGNQQCMAVLAAWLRSCDDPHAVLSQVFDVLDGLNDGATAHPADEGRYCFTLAFTIDAVRCGNGHLAWPKIPAASDGVLDALLRLANSRSLSTRFAAALAMSLQPLPASDARSTRILVMIANSSLDYMARGSAITALEQRSTPAELLLYLDRLPAIANSNDQMLEQVSVFQALAFATDRTGVNGDELRRWVTPRLLLPATTSHQESLQAHVLQKLVVRDLKALRGTIEELIATSPSGRVRRAAQRALQRLQ